MGVQIVKGRKREPFEKLKLRFFAYVLSIAAMFFLVLASMMTWGVYTVTQAVDGTILSEALLRFTGIAGSGGMMPYPERYSWVFMAALVLLIAAVASNALAIFAIKKVGPFNMGTKRTILVIFSSGILAGTLAAYLALYFFPTLSDHRMFEVSESQGLVHQASPGLSWFFILFALVLNMAAIFCLERLYLRWELADDGGNLVAVETMDCGAEV
ncbi:MAG: hypothetical protein QCI38_06250 [Candidatus Thermoplasmatota archaeon]|nr:hypothetical protein [Candidatus Thermoplasmatota archaeon]